jgi:signal transduction histidine kinase
MATATLIVTGLLLYRTPTHREYPDRGTPWWAMVAPYGAAAIMLAVTVIHVWDSALGPSDLGLLIAAVLVGALVIGRQAAAIRDNRRMVESEREALVSSISHELRTPLTSIVGFLNLYMEEAEDKGQEPSELIVVVQEESQYMARIVEDLMMLARNDPHTMELRDEPFDVRQQLNVSVRAADIDPESVTIECDPILGVVADRARLQQIVVNLLSNSARYGGPLRLIVATEHDGGLLLEVHDNGHGVPRKHELAIWQRFERGANRLNGAVPGSGIGLAIVDALAKAYNGATGYRRSERLGGACFWVDLPGRVTAHAAYRAPAEPVQIEGLAPVEPSANPLTSRVPDGRSGW